MEKSKIKAIAFDFGGTLDSPFLHWMDVYLHIYNKCFRLPLTRENFRDTYVRAEQMMERMQPVKPFHSLLDTQMFKVGYQFDDLKERGFFPPDEDLGHYIIDGALGVADYAADYVEAAKPVLEVLSRRYTLLLVSNYYGNLRKVVTDLEIAPYFHSVTDSTVEGVRKPDPELWRRAIERAGFRFDEVCVVGDSLKNDIRPALALGCQVVQGVPEGKAPEESIPSIRHLRELLTNYIV